MLSKEYNLPIDEKQRNGHISAVLCWLLCFTFFRQYRQILPNERHAKTKRSNEEFEKMLNDGRPIFLVLHGRESHRASGDRPKRYRRISEMGIHVLALDYRGKLCSEQLVLWLTLNCWFPDYCDIIVGFGDSGGFPFDENGPVMDAVTLFTYVRRLAPTKPLFLWGTSVGSGWITIYYFS